MEEVRQFVWYIEARDYVAPPGYAPADPQSMGSAVAVELETQMPDGTWVARKYLLTCGHVVRKATAKNGDGWGQRLMEVCCFRPEKAYLRTGEGERRSNEHRGAYLADVHASSPYSTFINESVPEPGRLPPHDWVLLDVKDGGFQLLPAVKVWGVGTPGMKLGLVGYPGGAGTAKKPVWKDFQDIVTSPSPREFILELTDLGMLNLSGAEAREGMSGGGYFSAADGALLGIHRSSRDEALARFGISIEHIRDELEKKRMRPVTRAAGPKAQAHPSADPTTPTPYPKSEGGDKDILPGVRLVHIMVAQIFRMEELYRKTEIMRPTRLHQILTNQAKWRRLMNGRKPLQIGDLGELRPLISSGERFDPFWRVSQSSQFRHDPFVYFIPLELNLSDSRNFSRFRCDLQAVLEGKSSSDISNCQVSGSVRIYPHGIGVVRLGLSLTFKSLAISSVIAKVVSSVQNLYFIDTNSVQTQYQTLVFETVGRVISAVYASTDSPENVCWLPPVAALSFVAQDENQTIPPIGKLASLMSRAPGNDEPEEVLARRLETAACSKGWRDGRALAVAGEGVALFYALASAIGGTSESLRRIQLCFREAFELVSVARYSGLAFAQQIETIAARRELDDTWLPQAGNEKFKDLLGLFEEMVAAKRATYQIKNHLQKTGEGILMSFAKQVWAFSAGQKLLDDHLSYVQSWAKSGLTRTTNQDLERLVYLVEDFLGISAPFDI